jgi:hypothetical protein
MLLYLNSAFRTTGTTTNFKVILSRNVIKTKNISLVYAKIENSTGIPNTTDLLVDIDVVKKRLLTTQSNIHSFVIPVNVLTAGDPIVFSEEKDFKQKVNNEMVNITEMNIELKRSDGNALALTDNWIMILRLD